MNEIGDSTDDLQRRKIAGVRLRQVRLAARESLRTTGKAVGLSHTMIWAIEHGEMNTPPMRWRRLAQHFGKSLDYFWEDGPNVLRERSAEYAGGKEVVYYDQGLVLDDADPVRREIRAIREEMVRAEQIRRAAEEQESAARDRLFRLLERLCERPTTPE